MSVERCPNCGTPYQEDASFCINCGMSKEEAAKAAEPKAEGPGESGFAPPKKAGNDASAGEEASSPEVAGEKETPSEEGETVGKSDTEPAAAPEPGLEPSPEPGLEPPPEPGPEPATEPEEPEEATARLESEMRPEDQVEFKPSKKGRGCCLAIVIAGIVGFIVLVIIIGALLLFGVIGGRSAGGAGDTYDFTEMKDADFEIWGKGEGAVVENENDMLVLKNAILGLEKDYGSDYGVEVTVFFASVDEKGAWAGPVLRVNPGGGDRYAFKLMPDAGKAVLGRDGDVLGEKAVNLETGKPYTVYAEALGNDLGFAVDDVPMVKASDIGLIAGGIGLEARGCTAYFDDLRIETME
jgi:hypothetical protein